eukprot:GHVP01041024.1.p1 GENE.GHVP01041024.1~~GHVP01041024.1.p1  ORF type:complete len:206 (-),score=30.45 GHVP01041024.1:65-682(-)
MIENLSQFASASTAFALIPNFSEDFEANMNAGPQEAVPYVGCEKKPYLDEESESSGGSSESLDASVVTVVEATTNNFKATPSVPAPVEESSGSSESLGSRVAVGEVATNNLKATPSRKIISTRPASSSESDCFVVPVLRSSLEGSNNNCGAKGCCCWPRNRYARDWCCCPEGDEGIRVGGIASHPTGEPGKSWVQEYGSTSCAIL